ncbi:tricarballylate dehydrogenase [compost metagenome]
MIDEDGQPIEGLYAAGELVGNLYYVKYAGGAGLTSGSVLGRIAGAQAAAQPMPGVASTTSLAGRY